MAKKAMLCYSRKDEELLQSLKTHLRALERQRILELWHDRDIQAGDEWAREIDEHLRSADVILLLISPDFIASDYCYSIEMSKALKRHEQKKTLVIPVILRPTHWQETPLGALQALPTDAEPVTSSRWPRMDDALFQVVAGVKEAIAHRERQMPIAARESVQGNEISLHGALARPVSPAPRKRAGSVLTRTRLIMGAASLLFVLLSVSGWLLYGQRAQTSLNPYAQRTSGKPAIDNLFTGEDEKGLDQDGHDCMLKNGVYSVSTRHNADEDHDSVGIAACMWRGGIFANFTLQVQMKILQGDGGGLLFRSNDGSFGYRFFVSQYSYDLNYDNDVVISSTRFQGHLNQTYLLTVIASGKTLSFYVNQQLLRSVVDNNSNHATSGLIGFLAFTPKVPTEVAFTNAKVWIL